MGITYIVLIRIYALACWPRRNRLHSPRHRWNRIGLTRCRV